MQRLNFSLPDFTRLSWVSDTAREVWEPRLRQVTKAWLEIEWLSVASGVRRCGVTMVSPEEFIEQAGKWATRGLSGMPVEIQGATGSSYSATSVQTELGKPFVFRVVIGAPQDVADFKQAFDKPNDTAIGRLLGYPDCCYAFFRDVWVEQGMVDTTWPMATATTTTPDGHTAVAVTGPPEANILWRWMGVRAVSHLPCRFDCEKTVALGKQFIEVGQKAGYEREMDWLLEILSWPAEWSALHGIAEIKTPVMKVSTRTDATAYKYIVKRMGEHYPAEGVRGLHFPYSVPPDLRLTESRQFREGLDNPIEAVADQLPEWYASDNGFPSNMAMNKGHQPILALALATLGGKGGNVLDLGCGNGALLKKIYTQDKAVIPFGIDGQVGSIEHAHSLLPEFTENIIHGDMFDNETLWRDTQRYALILLMPGRLLEVESVRATHLRDRLKQYGDHILVYAYGDWLTQFQNLAGLVQEAGFIFLGEDTDSSVGLARVQ